MLSLADLRRIQHESWADDVAYDAERMKHWSEREAREFFESGGRHCPSEHAADGDVPTVDEATQNRTAIMVALGACIPNAPIPDVPPQASARARASHVDVTEDSSGNSTEFGRIFCMSDLHTDHPANLEWCRELARSTHGDRTMETADWVMCMTDQAHRAVSARWHARR